MYIGGTEVAFLHPQPRGEPPLWPMMPAYLHYAIRTAAAGVKRVNSAAATNVDAFVSILGPGLEIPAWPTEAPPYFDDLNLGPVVSKITSDWTEYAPAPIFHRPLIDLDAIRYRQEVMRDLEDGRLRQAVLEFGRRMRAMREHHESIGHLYCKPEKERWFLEGVRTYCDAVERLCQALQQHPPTSRGLRGFAEHLNGYVASAPFVQMAGQVRALVVELSNIRYGLLIRGSSVTVRPYEGEPDYSETVAETFARFRRGATRDYRARFGVRRGLNHVESQVLERVALLHPTPFLAMETFCREHAQYQQATITRFDREVAFYLAYLSYIRKYRERGLAFCYPTLSSSKDIACEDAFDLALADRLLDEHKPVVCNGFALQGSERLMVVSGPNQGGKTTFARMFGQMHHFASLGCPVPGRMARLFLFDRLFTHFEREEEVTSLRGKLKDDLLRIHGILREATPDSLVILNEIFASTTLDDALLLSRRVMAELSALDLLGVCVTFLTELATFNDKTVSMVGVVDPEDPSVRTYRVERRPADGLAYAQAIARKYRVTGDWLRRRIGT